MEVHYQDLPFDITTIDTGLLRPGFTASYLIVENNEAAFVEVGPAASASTLLHVLREKHIAYEQVRYLIVTHVHLDHAGAAGTLLPHFPNAQVVVHPRGGRHLINPEKLTAGASAVYGAEVMRALFGEMMPVPQDRVILPEDENCIDLSGRSLLIRHTTGHARHHFCVIDERSQGIFTGDAFGLSYREFDAAHGQFIFPATAPVQFEPEAMHASVDMLVKYQPERLYLTHFGQVTEVPQLAERLHHWIDQFVKTVKGVTDEGEQRTREIRQQIEQAMLAQLHAHGCMLDQKRILDLLAPDLDLDVMGLEVWLDRLKKRKQT